MADLVYDVGMNIAEDTAFYLAKGFRVIAIEANPKMIEEASGRFAAEIGTGQLVLVNAAIADRPGSLTFYVCDSMSAWSTTDPALMEQWTRSGATFRTIEVEGKPFAEILAQFGMPRYLKIDIEGSDLLCIEALEKFESRPVTVSAEVDLGRHRELVEMGKRLGYKRFQLVGQSTVEKQKPPRPAREGADIDYTLVRGCSGLFGAELPDAWVSGDEAIRVLDSIRMQHRAIGAVSRLAKPFGAAKAASEWMARQFPATRDWYDLHMM